MRVHGLRALPAAPSAAAKGPSKRGKLWWMSGLVLLALGGAAAFVVWQRERTPDAATLASTPLSARVLQRELERASVKADSLVRLLEPDGAVEAFAQRAAAGQSSPEAKASAVVKAIRARAKSDAFVSWSLADPRIGLPLTAAQTLAAISKDHARKELYPLEVAALAVAALRAADVPAMLTEVYAWPGARAPLDPSGRFGYFGVALARTGGQPRVFDPYGGRPAQERCAECAVLSDLQAVGAGLSLMATQRLAQNEDPAAALRDADAAVKLAPSSPSTRSARGAVLLATGAAELGQGEFEAAAQMRPDPPRRNNLAMLFMALGDGERAAREVAQVLEQEPEFALGHVTLAEIHLARGERELARGELEKTAALDPGLPSLPLTWAQFYAAGGENEAAIEQGKRAVQARPTDLQAHLILARIYRQASRYDQMRSEARSVLTLAPPALNARTRELLERLLGPTALEPPADDAAQTAPSAAAQPPSGQAALPEPGKLDLSQGQDPDHSRLHLLDQPGAAPSDGTLKGGGGPPRLRLNEPGRGLKLGATP
jgi:tetratricopeptide (TPR) repeat protein